MEVKPEPVDDGAAPTPAPAPAAKDEKPAVKKQGGGGGAAADDELDVDDFDEERLDAVLPDQGPRPPY